MKKIFDKCMYIFEKEVIFKFNKGEIVFFNEVNNYLSDDRMWEIYGYVTENDYINKETLIKEIKKQHNIRTIKYYSAPNIKKKQINLLPSFIYSYEMFPTELAKEIHKIYEVCKHKYKIHKKDLKIYLDDLDGDNFKYFGYSIEEEIPKELMECKYKTQLVTWTYEDLFDYLISIHWRLKNEEDFAYSNYAEKEIREYLDHIVGKSLYKDMLKYVKDRVKGQVEIDKVVAGIYGYLNSVAKGIPCNTNIMITAPSGCGKTETFRAIRDYFKNKISCVPVSQVDLTTITPEGYKGKNINEVVAEQFIHPEKNGIGIVFIDEVDKRLIKNNDNYSIDLNAVIQGQLLTLIEGREVRDSSNNTINTANTLFIAMGSFDDCRKKRIVNKTMGFGSCVEDIETDYYEEITRDDIQEMGASYEFLGRFTVLANYQKLSKKIVNEIIDKYISEIEDITGYRVWLSDDKRKSLEETANGKYGCRAVKNMIYEDVLKKFSEVLIMDSEEMEMMV